MISLLSGSSDVPGFVMQNSALAESDSLMSNSYDVLAGQNLVKGILNVAEMYDPQTYQTVIE